MAKKKGKSAGTRYRKTITIGRDMLGNPIRKDFYAPTKKELTEKIEKFKIAQATGSTLVEPGKPVTFSTWAWTWFETYKSGRVEKNTEVSYKNSIKIFCEFFGDAPLTAIREADVVKFYASKKDRTESVLKLYHTVLKQIFRTAISNGLLTNDPMRDLKSPAGRKTEKRRSYTLDQYRAVLDMSKTHTDGLGAFIILKTGVRIAELCGLRGTDFDFGKKLLHIRRTLTDRDGEKPYGKTETSMRSIPLDDETVDFLSRRPEFHSDGLIFNGAKPSDYRKREYKKFQKLVIEKFPDFPKMRPHELRHSYGTLLYQAGTDLLTIARVMGHSNVSTTQKIYVHDTIDDTVRNIKFPGEK